MTFYTSMYLPDGSWASLKTSYDPCPYGWRVPDGGSNGVWSKAKGSPLPFSHTFDSSNEGMNFSGEFGADQTIWYPASGLRDYDDGRLVNVGYFGNYWSASPGIRNSNYAYYLDFYGYGSVFSSDQDSFRALGLSVRCLQESK